MRNVNLFTILQIDFKLRFEKDESDYLDDKNKD